MLDGPRESMRRFDARRQNENETLVEYEQALRITQRVGQRPQLSNGMQRLKGGLKKVVIK